MSLESQYPNAFDVMMSAQIQLQQKFMPDKMDEPKTNKQRLRNSLITFLTEKGCCWHAAYDIYITIIYYSEVQSFGMNLVNALTSTLWEIDGYHHVLSNQGYKIPSKHQKCQLSNLSGAVLESLSSHLFRCLHGGYWERDCWSPLKGDVELLAKLLAGYRDYLG